jgi:hypothetical protein
MKAFTFLIANVLVGFMSLESALANTVFDYGRRKPGASTLRNTCLQLVREKYDEPGAPNFTYFHTQGSQRREDGESQSFMFTRIGQGRDEAVLCYATTTSVTFYETSWSVDFEVMNLARDGQSFRSLYRGKN